MSLDSDLFLSVLIVQILAFSIGFLPTSVARLAGCEYWEGKRDSSYSVWNKCREGALPGMDMDTQTTCFTRLGVSCQI